MALLVGHLLRDTPGYMVRNPDGSVSGDITHYVYWTRLVTLGGIQSAYGGTGPKRTPCIRRSRCTPTRPSATSIAGCRTPAFDPHAAQQSLWLREGIKFVALTLAPADGRGDLLARAPDRVTDDAPRPPARCTSSTRRRCSTSPTGRSRTARTRCSACWRIGLLGLGQVVAPWAAMARGGAGQAAGVGLAAAAGDRDGARARPGRAGARDRPLAPSVRPDRAAVHRHRRLGELLSLPGTVSSVMPVVSADAHNLWWLVVQLARPGPALPPGLGPRCVGPLTYRTLAAGAGRRRVAADVLAVLDAARQLAEAAALGVLGWFTFTTQAHENHLFFALPLLSLAWPTRRWLLVPFGIVSLTCC